MLFGLKCQVVIGPHYISKPFSAIFSNVIFTEAGSIVVTLSIQFMNRYLIN